MMGRSIFFRVTPSFSFCINKHRQQENIIIFVSVWLMLYLCNHFEEEKPDKKSMN